MTATDYITLIVADLSQDKKPTTEEFTAYVTTVWNFHADKQRRGNRVRYLYTKRQAIDRLLSGAFEDVDWTDADVTEKGDQITDHLQAMRKNVEEELATLLASRNASAPAAAPIEKQFPIERDCNTQPDPNSRRLRGDPLRPPFFTPR